MNSHNEFDGLKNFPNAPGELLRSGSPYIYLYLGENGFGNHETYCPGRTKMYIALYPENYQILKP